MAGLGKWITKVTFFCSVILGGTSIAFAQDGGLGTQETTVHGGTLVMITYFVLFGLTGLYLMWIGRRQQKVAADLERLDNRIDEVLGQ